MYCTQKGCHNLIFIFQVALSKSFPTKELFNLKTLFVTGHPPEMHFAQKGCHKSIFVFQLALIKSFPTKELFNLENLCFYRTSPQNCAHKGCNKSIFVFKQYRSDVFLNSKFFIFYRTSPRSGVDVCQPNENTPHLCHSYLHKANPMPVLQEDACRSV